MIRSRAHIACVVAVVLASVAASGCKLLKKKAIGEPDAADVPDATAEAVVDASAEAAPEVATTAEAGAPAPSASVHAAAVDPGAVGTFGGQVSEGSLSYPMTVSLNDKGGSVSYGLPFNCKGTWTLTGHDGKSFHFKEHITDQGGRKCAQGETANLVELKPGQFSYQEGSAHATLNKR